jgi:hypothetical protein
MPKAGHEAVRPTLLAADTAAAPPSVPPRAPTRRTAEIRKLRAELESLLKLLPE